MPLKLLTYIGVSLHNILTAPQTFSLLLYSKFLYGYGYFRALFPYSDRKLFTGLVSAARMLW